METQDNRQDRVNWIKNLIQLMCCDGSIADRERQFLFKVARQLHVQVPDWDGLLKSVLKDARVRYPISDHATALAVLKSLIVMANADGPVNDNENRYILSFAKVVGVSNEQLKAMVDDINAKHPARARPPAPAPAAPTPAPSAPAGAGRITVVKDDFDEIDPFVGTIREHGRDVQIVTLDDVTSRKHAPGDVVCFHAAARPADTVQRYQRLRETVSGPLVAVLTRYQGHHVRYLLELGIPKCVIEPVYARDIEQICALAQA